MIDEPSRELTPWEVYEDWEWVRELYQGLGDPCKRDPYDPLCPGCRTLRWINFLLHVEAGRMKAEFYTSHHATGPCRCNRSNLCHNWNSADWLAAVRRERLGE